MQPCAQIADFLGRYCGRQPGSELFEPLRPRCDGSTNVIGQPGRDADVARIEIEAGARLFGTRRPKFFEQTAIDRIGLGPPRADNIETAIGRASWRESVCQYV